MTDDALFSPDDLLRVLTEEGVEYAIIGGNASVVHGAMRATFDLDIVPALTPDNGKRLAKALVRMEAKVDGVDGEALGLDPTDPHQIVNGANWTLTTRFGKLDVMSAAEAVPTWDELRTAALTIDMGNGVVTLIASKDHLVAMKRASGRRKDIEDIAAVTGSGASQRTESITISLAGTLLEGPSEDDAQVAAQTLLDDVDVAGRTWVTNVGSTRTLHIRLGPERVSRDFCHALADSFSTRLQGAGVLTTDLDMTLDTAFGADPAFTTPDRPEWDRDV